MRYLKPKLIPGRLLKRISFFILLMTFAASVVAQQRDTVPVKRNVVNKVLNRIFNGNKDTIKPKEQPDTNPNRNVISDKDTVPVKNVSINRDIPNNRIGILIKYPDTLVIGAYSIVVEEYDKGGEWNQLSKAYDHLSGFGRIRFNCPLTFTVWPGLWKEAVMKPVSYRVVDNINTRGNEISSRDAAALGLTTKPGDVVELMMPHYNGRAVDLSRYITDVKSPKKPEGIRVRFTDLSVSVVKAGATKGLVVSGIAKYPTEPPIPAVPFTLNISPGFKLEVSAITFSPGLDPLVTAILILPSSITLNNACAAGALDLGNFRLSPTCEFYKEYPGSDYGVFGIGNTTLAIEGYGYVVDFSSSQTYGPSGKPVSWKGVTLIQGESKGSPLNSAVSNIGYMQAHYNFSNGVIESSGLTATFNLVEPYRFATTQPYGYSISFGTANITVGASQVTGGKLQDGDVTLPVTAVQQANGDPVIIPQLLLSVRPSMDLLGNALIKPETSLYWGDLIAAGGGDRKSFGGANFTRQVQLFFSAEPKPPFNPSTPDGKAFKYPIGYLTPVMLDSLNIQGATLGRFNVLVVHTKDRPGGSTLDPNKPENIAINNKVWYHFSGKDDCWLNVVTEGVHCHIDGQIYESPELELGDITQPLYVGGTSFKVITNDNTKHSSFLLQCVESAVLNCDYRSFINEPAPVDAVLAFKEMVFTSTANNAGGDLVIGGSDSLTYWGLKLVSKPGFSSAGLVSVKTGQIIMTAAGLAEYKHFTQPFWLTWGEMLANGSMGRLFFDFHVAGQQFDKFNFIHNAVSLSPVDPDPLKFGFLRVGGTAFFPFFAGDYLHIKDIYVPAKTDYPFYKREIKLSNETLTGFIPSDLTIDGNWSDGLGIFHFNIKYADLTQDGFLGNGTSAVKYLSGGNITSTLDMNSRGTCIRIGSDLMDQRSISLGPVANVSNITRIWGCVCIKGDAIENLVVGGEVTNAANMSVAARVGSYLSAILQVTPSLARLTIDGEAYMSIMASLDAMVNGHMQLTLNHAEGFVEGEVLGKIRVAEGAVLVGSSLEAEGQLNWHLGIDFNELQGMVAMKIMGTGGGSGVGAGFYAAVYAPKGRAWVLLGKDPRYKLNMAPMPDRLTGVYGFLHVHQGINLYIVSGGYDLYLGSGAFLNTSTMTPYVVGNLGGRIYGEILGGLVSAAASFNLQMILGYPFGFQGTVGLEACVLWVACGSVDLTIGMNTTEGFYIR